MQRLPVYLVFDTSASMYGAAMESAVEVSKLIINQLIALQPKLGIIWVSVITFSISSIEKVEFCSLDDFSHFELPPIGGISCFGSAIDLLNQIIDRDCQLPISSQDGDWKPIVILFSDGAFSDNWQSNPHITMLINRSTIISIACGNDLDEVQLGEIGSFVFHPENLSIDLISSFIKLTPWNL